MKGLTHAGDIALELKLTKREQQAVTGSPLGARMSLSSQTPIAGVMAEKSRSRSPQEAFSDRG